ncbi:MAG: class I SAM-dependent methyltransferase [Pyrinomonadaceae bacterium]|nr:class I SAM-dependent methyltransferase [Pyrinomonadaceae bacterium]
MHLTYRQTCRVCGSDSLTPVINLGEQHLQGSFIKEGKELPPMRKIPCEIVRCNPVADETACGLLQMKHSVPPQILYAAYWYRSGTNNTMRNHLQDIAEEAVSLWANRQASVLDIGCNDGTLLKNYPASFIKYGVDPSDVAREVRGENLQVVQDVFPSTSLTKLLGEQKIDIITSIAMFYDLENPIGFCRGIKNLLSESGVWIFEMSYMPRMLELNSYDTICHEHLEYYSLAVLEKILKLAELKIFRVSFNDINGGSIRCYAAHAGNNQSDNAENARFMNEIRQQEFDLALDTDAPYLAFQARIEKEKDALRTLLIDLKKEGKRIHIYGASTKGNTILQFCDIDNQIIDYASERNPDKFGARTLGTNIPIISEADSRALLPDYYLVLPWHFKAEFVEREREMLEKDIGFIFPLPSIEIVKK